MAITRKLLSLAEITAIESAHGLGVPTLGHAAAELRRRWLRHVRDGETLIRLVFLSWYHATMRIGWPLQVLLALVPLLLTPALVYGLAEGVIGAGGGERDVLLAVPWLIWAVAFALCSFVLIYRRWTIARWVLRSTLVATGVVVGLWLVALAWSFLATA